MARDGATPTIFKIINMIHINIVCLVIAVKRLPMFGPNPLNKAREPSVFTIYL